MAWHTKTVHVPASSHNPISTGLNFAEGAKVTIVSEGVALIGPIKEGWKYQGAEGETAPSPPPEAFGFTRISMEANWGALLAATGTVFTPLHGGLLNWSPPTDDNLSFIVNDTLNAVRELPNGFSDNQGGFDVTVWYNDKDLVGRERNSV